MNAHIIVLLPSFFIRFQRYLCNAKRQFQLELSSLSISIRCLVITQWCTCMYIFRLGNGRFIRRIRSSSDAGGQPPAGNISIHSSARDIVHTSVQIVDTPISIYRPYV